MAKKMVEVSAKIDWERVDPDGSTCVVCGDAIYLKQYAPIVTVCFDGKASSVKIMMDFSICQSCNEALKQ